jgi:OmpA family
VGFLPRARAEQYTPQDDDTLEVIAQRETDEGRELTWQQIALFNWGTKDPDVVDEFLRDQLGCYKRGEDKLFLIMADVDAEEPLLIPRAFTHDSLALGRPHTLRVRKLEEPPAQFEACCKVSGPTFEFDKSFIRPSVVGDLEGVQQALTKHPEAKIVIFGHTDKVGRFQYNKELSERRALSVYAFITNDVDTWVALAGQEGWGLREAKMILADIGGDCDPGPINNVNDARTQAAVTNFQRDIAGFTGTDVDGQYGPMTRRALYEHYMSDKHDIEIEADRFLPTAHMGCGELNPLSRHLDDRGPDGREPDAAETEEKNEENRRVTFFLFNEDRLPRVPCSAADRSPCEKRITPAARLHNPNFSCSFYDSMAKYCICEGGKHVQPTSSVRPLIQFYSAPAEVSTLDEAKGDGATPKTEAQVNVVLLDRGIAMHQPPGEAKLFPDPTMIIVSLEQENQDPPYTGGGKLKSAPDHVTAFLDEKCTNPLPGNLTAGAPLTHEQLKNKQKLYLRGKTAGPFELTLELEPSKNPAVEVEEPAKQKMSVVELQLKLAQQDADALKGVKVDPNTDPVETYYTNLKDKALPEQKDLTDEEKVKVGRLLHAQTDGHFGRARLVLAKLESAHWPEGTDDLELVVNETNESGAVEVFDAEEKGTKQAFPLKIKVSALKAAEKVLWVEGKSTTKKRRAVRLDFGLALPSSGALRHGDFGLFTVVQIKEVKVDYKPIANQAVAWDEGKEEFYVNLLADPDGRKITIRAELTEKLPGVQVHFMLAPDKDNRKKANWGEDLPATWKWKDITWDLKRKDRADPKDLLHLSSPTDANGVAKRELVLSRFAGDVFKPGAYIDQDPHLAKYVHGHADLSKRVPALAIKRVMVRRKFWYQVTKAKGFSPPQPTAAEAAYRVVKTEMLLDQTKEFKEDNTPARTFYAKYILAGGNSETKVANVGDYNKTTIANGFFVTKTDQPVKNQLIVCSYQYDAKSWNPAAGAAVLRKATGQSAGITAAPAAGSEVKLTMNRAVFDPALHGVPMIDRLYWYRSSAPGTRHNLAANQARIPRPRANNRQIAVKLPTINPAPTVADPVFVVARCWAPWGPYLGESFGKHSLIVFDPTNVADFNDTVVHEIGHRFNQTPKPAAQPGAPAIPDHPNQADRGQGNHCQENAGVDAASGDTKFTCVMYDSGPMKWGLHQYCPVCHPYLLVENLHRP